MRSVRGSWPWQQAFANKPHGQISSSARSSSSQAASAQAASTWNRVEPLVLGHFPDTSPSLPRFFTRCSRSAVARYLPGTGRCQVCRVCQVAWVLRDVQGGPIRPVRGLSPRLASAANRTHPVVGVATRSNREQMSGSITMLFGPCPEQRRRSPSVVRMSKMCTPQPPGHLAQLEHSAHLA